jgi:hypothetical protein
VGWALKILGLHIRNSLNAGDRWSSPLEYFAFPGHGVSIGDMRDLTDWSEAVIYGGGSITASPDFRRYGVTVAWGVGHHVRQAPWHDAMIAEHERAAELCDLYFPRDCVRGFEDRWTPCASCMHPVFDEAHKPAHAVVRYSAARRIDVSNGIDPHMTNESGMIEEAVRFLASGEKVITSSYHGAYWAGLLGREVEVVPWGSKFEYVPQIGLEECREKNRSAHRQVLALLNG